MDPELLKKMDPSVRELHIKTIIGNLFIELINHNKEKENATKESRK